MMRQCSTTWFLVMVTVAGSWTAAGEPAPPTVRAVNHSYKTIYEEEDNVHVAFQAPAGQRVVRFSVEARHPDYVIGQDNGEPGQLVPANDPAFAYADSGSFKVYDDGTTYIMAVRMGAFWRPQAMTVRVGQSSLENAHFLQVHRRLPGTDSYPQIAVLYTDGNIRLKPFPQPGRSDQLFGSSIIIGPAGDERRPVCDLASLEYLPQADAFKAVYRSGGSATLRLRALDRQVLRLEVEPDYSGPAFARFRSMYVADGNSDADQLRWHDAAGQWQEDPILAFKSAEGGQFLLARHIRSRHNTSAPDYWVGNFRLRQADRPE